MGLLYIWANPGKTDTLQYLTPVLKDAGVEFCLVSSLKGLPEDKVVLVLGEEPRKLLANSGIIPKNRTISSMRHKAWLLKGLGTFLFSYSSGVKMVDSGKFTDLLCDTRIAARVAKTGEYAPKLGEYRWVDDFSEAIAGIKQQHLVTGKKVDAAFDTETIGTDPYAAGARFVSLQLTWQPGKSDAVYFESHQQWIVWSTKHHDQLKWLLTSPMISMCMANGKFDCTWAWVHAAIECTNFKFDTLLVGSLLDENRSNSLKVHAKIYTDKGGYDEPLDQKWDKSRMDLVPPSELLPYAGCDTDVCHEVRDKMRSELLQDNKLAGFYVNILHPAARAFEKIEQTGVCIDHKAYDELESQVKGDLLQLIASTKKLVPGRIFIKHEDSSKFGGINLTKASFLKELLFSKSGLNLKPKLFTAKPDKDGNQVPSTAMEHLAMFKGTEADPFIAILQEYGSAKKVLDSYITGFKKHIRLDGRFHPNYFLFAGDKEEDDGGTNTGRLSAKDPAFQTIPKRGKWGKLIRRCLIAPAGYVVLESDYSQGELRAVACVADEKAMIHAYLNGQDLHALTAGRASGYTYDEMMGLKKTNPELFDSLRQKAKAGNFGLLYGMGPEGFQAYAFTNYGVLMTLAEAEAFWNQFFKAYPGLVAYHQRYKAFAHAHGYVRSPLGRIRHLPLINSFNSQIRSTAERQAINSPIQGTLSDLMIWAMANWNDMGYQKEAPIFGNIHDASYTYAPEDKQDVYAKRMKMVMENLDFSKVGWKPQLKFIADVKVGPNMGDLEKLDLAA